MRCPKEKGFRVSLVRESQVSIDPSTTPPTSSLGLECHPRQVHLCEVSLEVSIIYCVDHGPQVEMSVASDHYLGSQRNINSDLAPSHTLGNSYLGP